MATQKALRILYQAKGNATGLADVKAQIYLNGVAKAVGGSAVVLTEVDATNSPGLYELLLSGATLTGYGVAAGSYNCIEGYIDSASKSAKAPFREELTVANTDDIDSKLGSPAGASVSADVAAIKSELGTPAGASVSADIAAVKSDTGAIKIDLESGTYSLQNILTAIQAVQNNAGFAVPVPAQLFIPASGSNSYRIPVTVYNTDNALIDPDSNTITVGLVNQAGSSRTSFLGSTTMTRDSLGQYHVDLAIPSTEVEEELLFTFTYAIGGATTARRAVSQTVSDVLASGYALQSTLLDVQTTVNDIDSLVNDGTVGLAAIVAILANATYGLSALETILTNATYGLSALQVQAASTQGSGFVSATDSNHAISAYLLANLFLGGRAV